MTETPLEPQAPETDETLTEPVPEETPVEEEEEDADAEGGEAEAPV